nr:hypothetical protein [Tanacetum cinerariifolium]
MMTTEYCPATKIQRMEQELWTLNLKGDYIEAYNNRFHELTLMCPELVSTKKKKIEKYIRGFPERIKGNTTSSKSTTLHDAINMAYELVEQAVQGRAARIGEKNKRKWEDHQRNTNNRNQNNNHHQQQNRRHETARAYAAAPAEGRGYARNLPRTLQGQVSKRKNQQNEGARGRAYVVVENPQLNLNVVTGTFILNDHYACILFDYGAEKSFVYSAFTPFIDSAPAALNTSYEVELSDGKVKLDDIRLSETSLRHVASFEISIQISFVRDVRVVKPAKEASRKGFYKTKSLTMESTRAFCPEDRRCDENVY